MHRVYGPGTQNCNSFSSVRGGVDAILYFVRPQKLVREMPMGLLSKSARESVMSRFHGVMRVRMQATRVTN